MKNKYIQSFNENQEKLTGVSDSDFLLKTIADRIRNNVDIIEYADGRETELNIEDCIKIIKDDLSKYSITLAKKDI
jgi:predicted CopG family antitoxin